MLARVTEVPPIIASSIHIETSVIQDLQAREEWDLVSGQDKPTVTGGLVSDNDSFHISSKIEPFSKPYCSIYSGPRGFVPWREGSQLKIPRPRIFPGDLGVAKRHNFTSARPLSSSRLSSSHGKAFAQDSEYEEMLVALRKVGISSSTVLH
jgi:hypothetical protein